MNKEENIGKELIPIDTEYKGYYFRSRLEARWAVFFEKIGWTWRYELEGFKLPSGNYLPDFYFPEINCYAEVKPQKLNNTEFTLASELSEKVGKDQISMILLEGEIKWKVYRSLTNGAFENNVIIMPKSHSRYPFYLTDTFDKNYFHETASAISYARKARFEFEWKEI